MPTTTGEMPARIWETTRVHSPISAKRERINPNHAQAYNNRGNTRRSLGSNQDAIADFERALRINPNLFQAYYNRGLARRSLGDKQGALADYNETRAN